MTVKIRAKVVDLAIVKDTGYNGSFEEVCLVTGSFVATDGVCEIIDPEYNGKQTRYLEYIT